jgi:hypothetical protein
MRAAGLALALLVAAPAPWEEGTVGRSLSFEDAAALPQDALVERGRRLFAARFTDAEGAGRPRSTQADIPTPRRTGPAFQRLSGPDAASCTGCHNDPLPGGAGDFAANAFTTEGLRHGDFDILDPQFSSERNTNHLFGAGLVELLAREMTAELRGQRAAGVAAARAGGTAVTVPLMAKGIGFGRLVAHPDGTLDTGGIEGVDPDLAIRPFSQKGVVGTLRRFTVNAMNAHHGMQADERFGLRWIGTDDPDGDGVTNELGAGDIAALVAFQATLPPPVAFAPTQPEWTALAEAGERHFAALGCAGCHVPALPLASLLFTDPAPVEGAGTLRAGDVAMPIVLDLEQMARAAGLARDAQGRWLVPLYGDLKRYGMVDNRVADLGDETISQGFVPPEQFATAELWGVADTAPYGHRGTFTTLDRVIRAHGGAGRAARDAYVGADEETRRALIAFLRTLTMPR